MKLNVRIDPALHLEAKRYALEHGTTFSALLREVLQEKLGLEKTAQPFTIATDEGDLQPGVEPDSNAEMLEVIEKAENPE